MQTPHWMQTTPQRQNPPCEQTDRCKALPSQTSFAGGDQGKAGLFSCLLGLKINCKELLNGPVTSETVIVWTIAGTFSGIVIAIVEPITNVNTTA